MFTVKYCMPIISSLVIQFTLINRCVTKHSLCSHMSACTQEPLYWTSAYNILTNNYIGYNMQQVSGRHFLGSRAFLSSRLGQIHCRNPALHLYPPSPQASHGWYPARRERSGVGRSTQWGNLMDSSCLHEGRMGEE